MVRPDNFSRIQNGIKNHSYVVIGGSGLLGSAVCRMLIGEGASKVYNFDIKESSPLPIQEEKDSVDDRSKEKKNKQTYFKPSNLIFRKTDISDTNELQQSFQYIRKNEPQNNLKSVISLVVQPYISRLVNTDDLRPISSRDFEKSAEVNLFGRYHALKCAAAALASSKVDNRSIIGLSSVFADDGVKGQAGFSALLGSLNSMTLPAARDLSQFGIRINNICPGYFISNNGLGSDSNQTAHAISELIEFPKRMGNGEDLAHCVKFMIENEYINGVNLRLDGAMRSFP